MISARNDDLPPPVPLTMTPRESESASLSLSQRITAACAGALLTSLAVTPFDVVKVRLQSSQRYVFCGRFFDQVEPCCTPSSCSNASGGKSSTWWRMMRQIGRQEGWSSLWRGMLPTLTMAIPATVVYYVGYESLRDGILTDQRILSPSLAPLLAGGGARLVAATLVSPLELLRTRMQANLGLRAIPLRDWWRGLGPTLWRDVPFSALYWLSYEQIRLRTSHWHPTGAALVAGAMAGMTAAFLTTPFDVVKTRRQVQSGQEAAAAGTWRLLRVLFREEGLGGLFRGVVPRILKVAPACAIMIGTYETGKYLYLE